MLKRVIEYEDFEGNKTSDTFYFNLSKSELIELEVEYKQGYAALLQKIIETKDDKELIKQFKEIILMTYGVKSDDGKKFIKSDELRKDFVQSAAYDALFMELATDDDAAVRFLSGVLPRDMIEEINKLEELRKAEEKKENKLITSGSGTTASDIDNTPTAPAPPTS